MKTMPSLKDSILSLVHYMRLPFDGDRFPQFEAMYQFIFTDVDDGFPVHVKFSKGAAEHSEGLRDRIGSDLEIELLTPIEVFAILCHGAKTPN
jgi:hypothetical protein